MARRIIGRDYSPQSRKILQQANQVRDDAMDILGVGNQRFAEISNQITQNAIDSNNAVAQSAIAASENAGASARARAQGLADVARTIQGFGELEQREAQRRLQAIQQQQEQLNAVETAQASLEIEQLVSQAPAYIKSKSPQAFENEIHKRLSKYQYISPENAQELFKTGYQAMGQVNKQIYDDVQEYNDEINAQIMSTKKANLDIMVNGVTSRIKTWRGDTAPLFEQFDNQIRNFFQNPDNAGLSPLQIAELQAYAMEKLAKSSQVNQEARAQAEEKAASAHRFINGYTDIYQQYANQPELLKAKTYELAQKTGFPYEYALDIGDPLQARREYIERVETNNQISNLQMQGFITEANKIDHDNKAIGYVALNYLNDAEFATRIDNDPRYKDLIFYQAGKRVAERLEEYNDLKRDSAVKLDSLAKSLSQWNSSTTKYVMSQGQGGDPGQMLNQFISFYAENNPEMVDRLESLKASMPPPINPQWDEEQIEMATEQWKQWREEGASAIRRQMNTLESELEQKASALAPYGLQNIDPNDPGNLEVMREAYRTSQQQIKEISNSVPTGGVPQGARGNFNQGEPVSFLRAKNTLGNEMILPFRPGTKGIRVGHGYGAAGSPRHGRSRNHGGLDVAAPMGTPVISPVDGEVVLVNNNPNNGTGYGKFIDIKDSQTGRIHRFAHASAINVKRGDTVGRGQEFMLIGSTGRSTGPHLHWELRTSSAGRFENTLDLETFAQELNNHRRVRKPRGNTQDWYSDPMNPYDTELDQVSQIEDTAIPGRAIPLEGKYSVMDGKVYKNGQAVATTEQAYTQSSPMRNSYQRYDKQGFNPEAHNKPENNYGYAPLARDKRKARKINEVATRLGIPAVWLADVISFESGFSPSIDNGYDPDGDGHGYVGLIQFGKAAAQDLGTTPTELKNMNFEQQMEYVYKYLNQPWFRGKLNTAGHVLAAVFGGPGLVNKLNSNPQAAYNTGDINIKFGDYIKRLGRDVGRQYNVPGLTSRSSRMNSVIHERYHANCPVCNSIAESGSGFYPHEAQA